MSADDLESRLARALSRHVDRATEDPGHRPASTEVVATARRRTARRRTIAGGAALAALALVGAAVVATRPDPGGSQHVDVATGAPTTTSSAAPPPATSTTLPAEVAPVGGPVGPDAGPPLVDPTGGSTTSTTAPATTTPEYDALRWFGLVDGVEVAWGLDGGRTRTWARSAITPAAPLGIEGTEPRAFAVPSRPGELVVVVFAGPDDDVPTEASVTVLDDEPEATTIGWADVTWDPVASVGWARIDWPGSGDAPQDLAVTVR